MKRILTSACCVLLFAVATQAAETTWQGASGADWAEASNWSNGVPGANDTAIFTTAVTVTPPDSFAGVFYVNGGVTVTADIAGACAFTLRTAGDGSGFTKAGSGQLTLTPYRRLTRGTVTAAAGTLVFSGPGSAGDPGAFDKVIIKAGAAASVANSAIANRHGVIVHYGQYTAEDTQFTQNTLYTTDLFDTAWDSHFDTVEATRGSELRLVTAANPLLRGTDIIPSACAGKSDYTVAFRGVMLFDYRNFSYPYFYFTRHAGSRGGIYLLSYSNGYRNARFDADITSDRSMPISNYLSGDYGFGSIDAAMQFTAANPGGMTFTRLTHMALRENGVIDDALIWYGACCNDLKVEAGASFNVPAGQAFAVGDASNLSLQPNTLTGAAGSLFAIMGGNAGGTSKYLSDAVFTGLSGMLELGRPAGLKLTSSAVTASYAITGYGEVWLTATGAGARIASDYAGIVNVPADNALTVPAAWGTDMEFHGAGTLTLADAKHEAAAAQFQGTVVLPTGATVVADTMAPAANVALGEGNAFKIGAALQRENDNPEVETAAPYTDSTAWTFLGKMNATSRTYTVAGEKIVKNYQTEPATAYVNDQGELQLTFDGGQVRAAYLNRVIARDDVMDATFTYTLDHSNLPAGEEEDWQNWGEGGSIILQCNGITADTGMNATYADANPLQSYGIAMHTYNERGLRWINDGMTDDLVSENDGVTISVRKAIDYHFHYENGILRVEASQDGAVWKSSRDISALFDKGKSVYFGFTGRGSAQNQRSLWWVNTRVSNLTITFRKAPLAFEAMGGDYAFTTNNYQIGYHSAWNEDGSLFFLPNAKSKQGKAVLKKSLSPTLPFSMDWTMAYDQVGSAGAAEGSSFTLQATGPDEVLYDAARGLGGIPKTTSFGMMLRNYDNTCKNLNGLPNGSFTNVTAAGVNHFAGAGKSQAVHLDYDGAGGFSWRVTQSTSVAAFSCTMPGVLEMGDVYPSFFGNQSWANEMYLGTVLKDVTISMPPTNGYATAYAGAVTVTAGATAALVAGSFSRLDTAEAMTVATLNLEDGATLNVRPEQSNAKVAFATAALAGDAALTAEEGAVVRLEALDLTALDAAATLTVSGKIEFGETLTVKIPDALKGLDTLVKIIDLTDTTRVGALPTQKVVTDTAGTVLSPSVAYLSVQADGIYLGKKKRGLLIMCK